VSLLITRREDYRGIAIRARDREVFERIVELFVLTAEELEKLL